LCLNEEGQVLFKWKKVFLEDADDSLSNWNASDNTLCLWNVVKCTQDSVTVLDFSSLPFAIWLETSMPLLLVSSIVFVREFVISDDVFFILKWCIEHSTL